MPFDNNRFNQVTAPVDLAQKMLEATQQGVFDNILGPEAQQRQDRIGPLTADTFIQSVLQDLQNESQELEGIS